MYIMNVVSVKYTLNDMEKNMNETLQTNLHEREYRLSEKLDFYKLTMGQLALEKFPTTEVTFTMKNRAEDFPLAKYVTVENLQSRLDSIRERGFTDEEIVSFAALKALDGSVRFDAPYLDYLSTLTLPEVFVTLDDITGDLSVNTTGDWAAVSLWETVVMSEINEEYYIRKIESEGLSLADIKAEGDRRLDEKIALLRTRPDIKISDFGTRRRFSADWHEHVISRLVEELPDSIVGTSNPWFAHTLGITPIGTYAHEMPMVYAALEEADGGNPLDGHNHMMEDWYARYGKDLSIALTDTFTSEFFFMDFTNEEASNWRGLRHDSGDPIAFGERVIDFYKERNIDPTEKTIVFSDGLDIDAIIALADHFGGRINVMFGWGTSLMNDLGLRANNFVMKATKANGIFTVKLSDTIGKHTGPEVQVERYINDKEQRMLAYTTPKEVTLA